MDRKSVQEVSKQAAMPTGCLLYYDGAGRRIRTDDLLITNQLLYQLSYAGAIWLRILAYKSAVNKLLPKERGPGQPSI
jgi:hypothetical protein